MRAQEKANLVTTRRNAKRPQRRRARRNGCFRRLENVENMSPRQPQHNPNLLSPRLSTSLAKPGFIAYSLGVEEGAFFEKKEKNIEKCADTFLMEFPIMRCGILHPVK